jgi:SAM-dependent methyltransferase
MAVTQYSDRQRFEKQYHDEKYSGDATSPDGLSAELQRRFWSLIGQPRRQTILDFGCGNGWVAVQLAALENRVYGFDISPVLIERATREAAAAGVAAITTFEEMAAEDLKYPDASFDLVVGSSILHHTELGTTLANIKRVLKADGTAVFMEPLNENFILRTWRFLTPWRRSRTERALTAGDIETVRRLFPETRFSYYGLTSILSQGLLLAVPSSRVVRRLNAWMERLDDRVLRARPSLGSLSAVVFMQIRK